MFLLAEIVRIYSFVVFAAVLISWVPSLRNTPVGRWIEMATEPVFARIRAVVPPLGGLDLSPLLLLFALQLLSRLLIRM